MEELLAYRRDRIPELNRIISHLPNHGIISAANAALEEAIDRYIDVIVPSGSPVQRHNENSEKEPEQSLNRSFMVLNPAYDEEAAAWGGRRKRRGTKRSGTKRRGSRRR